MRREILLTGATGVLGSELIAALLRDRETQLWLLIRASSDAELARRLRELLGYAFGSHESEPAQRVRAVRGDVAEERLGLDAASHSQIARAATHVIHAAADVSFDRSLDEARRTVVGATREVIRLARHPGPHGATKKLEYVSTVGVAGRRSGLILEQPMPPAGCAFRNTYEQSKAEAEQLVLAEMSDGLHVTIHRPSMIVGESTRGRIRNHHGFYFLVDYFLGLKGDVTLPECGEILMDTVPVDYVANAIAHSASSPDARGRIWHLCAGQSAWTIAQVIGRARELLQRSGRELASVVHVPLARYHEHLVRQQAAGSRLHGALAQFEPYFSDRIAFDNRRACESLSAAGIDLPAVDHYLDVVLTAYWGARARPTRAAAHSV